MKKNHSADHPASPQQGIAESKPWYRRIELGDQTKSLLCYITLALLPFLVFWKVTTLKLSPIAGDIIAGYYPMQYFINQLIRQGHVPLWNNHLFSGIPLHATQSSLYPPNLLFLPLPAWVLSAYTLPLHLALAGIFMFLYARALGIGRKGAFVAGVTFMFCGFTISHLGHLNIVRTVPWLPLILWAIERWRQRFELKYIGLGAVAIGFMLLGGHPQVPLYSLAVVAAYVLHFVLFPDHPNHRWRTLFGGIGMVSLGLLIASPILWDLYQMSQTFERPIAPEWAYDVFSGFSLPPVGLTQLIFPRIVTEVVQLATEVTGYVGILPLALATLAAFRWRHKVKYLFLVIAGLSLILALGAYTPLNRLMFHVPIYNSFRAPARNLFEFNFVVAVLAGAGFHRLVSAPKARDQDLSRSVWILVGALLALGVAIPAILIWGFSDLVLPTSANGIIGVLTNRAVWLPLVLILASSAVLLIAAYRPKVQYVAVLAAGLVVADLYFSFAAGHLAGHSTQQPHSEIFAEAFDESPASVEFLKQDPSQYRVVTYSPMIKPQIEERYALLVPDLNMLFDVDSADAYYGDTTPVRYGAFTNHAFSGGPSGIFVNPYLFWPGRHLILNLLNVKYVLVPANIEHPFSTHTVVDGVGFDGSMLPGLELGASVLISTTLVAPPYPATELAITSSLMGGGGMKDDEPIARIVLTDADGQTSTHDLLAGKHVSDMTYDCEPWLMKHQKAPLAYALPGNEHCMFHIYLARLELGAEPVTIRKIALEYLPTTGGLLVSRMSLYDAQTSSSYPVSVAQGNFAYLSQGKAYRLAYEDDYVRIYENTGVLPRAFLVPQVELVYGAREADQIVLQGLLPDGQLFSPREVALVEATPAESPPAGGNIGLLAHPIQSEFWTVVQWQDALGNWHDVEGWQGPFDSENQVVWWVAPEDHGKGPFRWVIHESQGGPLLAASDPFSLPASTDESVRVQIPLLWTSGEQDSPTNAKGDSLEATVISAEAGRMVIQTASDHNAFLVYSENYFPGWTAKVDGQPVEVYRTDGTLLGVPVPGGQHTVVLSYRPPTLYLIILSGMVTSALIIGLISLALGRRVLRNTSS